MDVAPLLFAFKGNNVRVIIEDGETLWVNNDVCGVLDIGNPRQALTRLDDDEKRTVIINDGLGHMRETSVITEPGLFKLILTSRKQEAKEFQRWVTHDVLRSIRRTGSYVLPAAPAMNTEAQRRLKLENDKLEKENERASRELVLMDIDIYNKALDVLQNVQPQDERAKIYHADAEREVQRQLLQAMSQRNGTLAITSGNPIRREVTFEDVARERGLDITPAQIQKKRLTIGKAVAQKYRDAHGGQEPVKHHTLIGGKSISVNTYYEEDMDLIADALKDEFGLD